MKKYDIAVIGGGFAGVAAALASAREGAKVIIIEKSNCLGGAAVNALVNPFMPYKTAIGGEKVSLSSGIFSEIHKKLEEIGAMRGESFLEEELKYLLNEMTLAEGIDLLFHASLFACKKGGEKITSVSLSTKCGVVDIEADYFIDASGDAQLAYLAGCPTVLGREPDHLCQPMTLCFRVGNADVNKFFASRPALQEEWKKHLAAGEFINPRENILVLRCRYLTFCILTPREL